jgi:hypothetical protein
MQEKQAFERIEVSRAEALEIFAENKFKATFFFHILLLLIIYYLIIMNVFLLYRISETIFSFS